MTARARTGSTAPALATSLADVDELLIADLSGMELSRRVVAWLAAMLTRRAVRRVGAKRTAVLVFAPFGDANTLSVPAGVQVHDAATLVDDALRDAVSEWSYETSIDLVRGAGRELFPEVHGVHFGELNLAWIQSFVRDYALLAAAARTLGGRISVNRCTVVAGSRDVSRGLANELRTHAKTVRAWYPPQRLHSAASFAKRVLRRNTVQPAAPLPVVSENPLVLMAGDSMPMRLMFDAVEARLAAHGVVPVMRMNYVQRANEDAVRSGALVARVAPQASACSPEAQAVIEKSHRSLQQVIRREGSAPAPLRALFDRAPVGQFLQQLSAGNFVEQAAMLEEARAVLSAARPGVVVVGNDRWWFGQAFVRIARQMQIPSVSLQDGIEGPQPYWFWASADFIGTTGSIYPDYLIAHGADPLRIRVIGQPRYDRLFEAAQRGDPDVRRPGARKALGVPDGAVCVLFAAQTEQDPAYTRLIADSVLAVPSVHLVVRPHPSARIEPYLEIFSNHPSGRVTLQPSGDSFDVLSAADLIVLQHSTVTVEAAILGRPTVMANFSGLPDPVPFAELGVAQRVTSGPALTAAVAEFAAKSAAERADTLAAATRALERLIGPQDGAASDRAAALIEEALAPQSHPGMLT